VAYIDKTDPGFYLDASAWTGTVWETSHAIQWQPASVVTPAKIRLTFIVPSDATGFAEINLWADIYDESTGDRQEIIYFPSNKGIESRVELPLEFFGGEFLRGFTLNTMYNGASISLIEWDDQAVAFWTNFNGQTETA
jgi:hypothetical protein